MTWTSGGTIVALYLTCFFLFLCLWPGKIRQHSQERLARWFWWSLAAQLGIVYILLACDIYLLTVKPVPWVDHGRRWMTRWVWVGLYGVLAWKFWRIAVHAPPWRRGMFVTLCGGGLFLMTGSVAMPQSPQHGEVQAQARQVWANPRSKIYHVPGCASYRTDKPATEYRATEAEAQQAGYRKAKTCPAEPLPPPKGAGRVTQN